MKMYEIKVSSLFIDFLMSFSRYLLINQKTIECSHDVFLRIVLIRP